MADAGQADEKPLEPTGLLIPDRYEIRASDDDRALVCDEAPRVRVLLDRGLTFSEHEARLLGERVILLDGVGRFGPLVDNKRRLYNLDHHESCQRSFTLASCEQALVLVFSGLPLGDGDWTVYANEPDLDTILAIWCLLNYARVTGLAPEARDVLFPMIRLEGAIDANGTELAQICGLPGRTIEETRRLLDRLQGFEQSVKRRGEWQSIDLYRYTLEMLQEIDALIFSSADFHDYRKAEEVYGHVEIGERVVAVACRDSAGIYAVERHLRQRWGDQLGVIALEKEPGHFTLRRSAPLADVSLHDAYAVLNRLDQHVDGHPPGKRWGGSESIGGSPRPTGTALAPREVLSALRAAYLPPTRWQRARRVMLLALLTAGVWLVAGVAGLLASAAAAMRPGAVSEETAQLLGATGVVLVAGAAAARVLSGRRAWLLGWRRPAGRDWLWLVPAVWAGSLVSGSFVPSDVALEVAALAATGVALALAALATELWFRGCVHGALWLQTGGQNVGQRWFVSRAALLSAGLYAGIVTVAGTPRLLGPTPLGPALEAAVIAAGAFVSGLALAMLRERSLSLWPGILVLALGLGGALALTLLAPA